MPTPPQNSHKALLGRAPVPPRRSVARALAPFFEKPVAANFLLGMAEAYPRILLGTVLAYWLTDVRVSSEVIGLFAAVVAPYSLKIGWSPLVDRLPLHPLTRWFGQRRGWLLVVMAMMGLGVTGMAATGPAVSIGWTYAFALLVGFGAALHDTVVDAYRIEFMAERHYGPGATALTFGYRALTLGLGWAAPAFSDALGWPLLFMLTLFCLLPLALVMLWLGEPPAAERTEVDADAAQVTSRLTLGGWGPRAAHLGGWLYAAVVAPFREFQQRRAWLAVLLFILTFKLSDAVVQVLLTDFLRNGVGFSKAVLAEVKQVVGGVMFWAGVAVSAIIYGLLGLWRTLALTVVLMAVTNFGFVLLYYAGPSAWVLGAVISAENLVSGMSGMVMVALLSHMTSRAFAATQYALLSSLASVGYVLVGVWSGFLKTALGWPGFFYMSVVVALPSLLLLALIWQHPGASAGTEKA